MNGAFLSICCVLLGLAVTSCTSVDTGGFLDSIGKEIAELKHYEYKSPISEIPSTYGCNLTPIVYRKDNLYYVHLEVVYIRSKDALIRHQACIGTTMEEWPEPISKKEISELQTIDMYAVLTPEQYEIAMQTVDKFETHPLSEENFPIILASAVNLETAERISQNKKLAVEYMLLKIPNRRTFGNYLRYPIVILADCVDVPLSLIATPIGIMCEIFR